MNETIEMQDDLSNPRWALGHKLVAAGVFLFTLVAYSMTLTSSVPFWDSGEFIATAYVLGIPHPPGTPLYVLIGRIFSMVPIASVAVMVNWLSAIGSALAVLFTFLLTARFIRLCQGDNRKPSDEIIAWIGGVSAALFTAFSKTYWDSAIEAEVYALSSWMQVFILWLALKWWEGLRHGEGDNRLLAACYLCFLSVGIHLGTFLVVIPLMALVAMVNLRSITFLFPALYVIYLQAVPAVFGPEAPFLVLALLPIAVLAGAMWVSPKWFSPKNVAWASVLAVVGLSVHLYLYIRAKANPPINEGDPETLEGLRALLMRDQYGSRPIFPRSASWGFQFQHYFGYFTQQYLLSSKIGALAWAIPLALGLFGAVGHFARQKKTFIIQALMFTITSFGLLVYLNFTDHEVRERDYFYTSSFHFFAIWIGMGLAFVVEWLRDAVPVFRQKAVLAATAVAVTVFSLLPMFQGWYIHDRSNFWVARDYAANMLEPLEPNAFVFTNGDNDTFPLWYLQEVEKVRKDIRVINLSLLNTDWYVKQLRDEEPRVPMNVSDEQIARIRTHGYFLDASGQPQLVNEFMVQNILQANAGRQPAYIAVTVPNHHGLDDRMVLEALVYRIREQPPSPTEPGIARTQQNWMHVPTVRTRLYDDFLYRHLFDENGNFMDRPYKDENAMRLSQNYAAAHIQLAYYHRRIGEYDTAIAELERVLRMFPDFQSVEAQIGAFYIEKGDTLRAIDYFRERAEINPTGELYYYYGMLLGMRGDRESAKSAFRQAIALDPSDPQTFIALFTLLYEEGRFPEGRDVLRQLLTYHPNHNEGRAYLALLDTVGRGPSWTGNQGAPGTGSGQPPGGQ